MDETKSIFDEIDETEEARAIAEAEAEIDAGKGVPHKKSGSGCASWREARSLRHRASNLVAGRASRNNRYL